MTKETRDMIRIEIDRRAREAQTAWDEIEELFARPSDPARDQLDAHYLQERSAA